MLLALPYAWSLGVAGTGARVGQALAFAVEAFVALSRGFLGTVTGGLNLHALASCFALGLRVG